MLFGVSWAGPTAPEVILCASSSFAFRAINTFVFHTFSLIRFISGLLNYDERLSPRSALYPSEHARLFRHSLILFSLPLFTFSVAVSPKKPVKPEVDNDVISATPAPASSTNAARLFQDEEPLISDTLTEDVISASLKMNV